MHYYINEPRATQSKKFNATLNGNILKLREKETLFSIELDVANFSVISIISILPTKPLEQKEIDKAIKFAKSIIIKK